MSAAESPNLQATKTRRHEAILPRERRLHVFAFSWQKARRILMVVVALGTVGLAAQGPPGLKTGNPTPGVSQPATPDLGKRITLTGCLQPTGDKRDATRAETANVNSPSDARFTLGSAKRSGEAPPGTGSRKAPAEADGTTYRLLGLDSQLLPFIGMRDFRRNCHPRVGVVQLICENRVSAKLNRDSVLGLREVGEAYEEI